MPQKNVPVTFTLVPHKSLSISKFVKMRKFLVIETVLCVCNLLSYIDQDYFNGFFGTTVRLDAVNRQAGCSKRQDRCRT